MLICSFICLIRKNHHQLLQLPIPLQHIIPKYRVAKSQTRLSDGTELNWYSRLFFSHSVISDTLWSHGLQHARLPCPSPFPWVCSNSCLLIGDVIQPPSPLLSPSPRTFNLSQHQGLSKWVSSSHQVAKVLEFQLQHESFQWIFKGDLL